jgi:hypothetical protein
MFMMFSFEYIFRGLLVTKTKSKVGSRAAAAMTHFLLTMKEL